MTKVAVSVMLSIICAFAFGDPPNKSIEILKRRGLKAKITVEVTDSCGDAIPDAIVTVHFQNGRRKEGFETFKTKTDNDGRASVQGRIQISAIVNVGKSGYHSFSKEYTYLTLDSTKMDGDKWKPYERIVQVTLLERRRSTSTRYHTGYIRFPLSTNDFEVFLNEKGRRIASMEPTDSVVTSFTVHWECEKDGLGGWKRLKIQSREGCGFIVMKKGEESSGMVYPYEFPTNGYEKCYIYEDRWQGRDIKTTKFDSKSEFLAFRLPFFGGGYQTNVADTAWCPKWLKRCAEGDGEVPMPEFQYGMINNMDFGVDYEKGEGIFEFESTVNYDEPGDPACEYGWF